MRFNGFTIHSHQLVSVIMAYYNILIIVRYDPTLKRETEEVFIFLYTSLSSYFNTWMKALDSTGLSSLLGEKN